VINKPVWASPDIPVYLFLGGLAGLASLLGAGAQATGRSALGLVSKAGAFSAGVLSLVGLVHNLGRPSRFLNMLRVFKVTSPMNVGSWILAGYVPLAGVAAASSLFGKAPRIGMAATAGDRRALLPRPWRRLRPRRQHPVGNRPRRGTARQAQPSVQRGIRRGSDGRVGRHRWGIFHAGMQSATDPKYMIVPQRERLRAAAVIAGPPAG
jgi:hypothetical protein